MPGRLKVHVHRPLPADASIRSCVFTEDDKGRSASLTHRVGAIAVDDLSIADMTRSAKGTVDRPGTNARQKSGLNRH